jgi:hypothetical protein
MRPRDADRRQKDTREIGKVRLVDMVRVEALVAPLISKLLGRYNRSLCGRFTVPTATANDLT